MSVRITILADNDIKDLSATDVATRLRAVGVKARRTSILKLNNYQYKKALEK